MDLLFSGFEVASIGLAVYITRNLTIDGESNWLEGLMLLAVYLMLGYGFFLLPGGAIQSRSRERLATRNCIDPVKDCRVTMPIPFVEVSVMLDRR